MFTTPTRNVVDIRNCSAKSEKQHRLKRGMRWAWEWNLEVVDRVLSG